MLGRIHIQTHRLMEGIYEICHDIHTKFHKDWFRHSKVDRKGIHRHTARMEIA
jgi:hypothetical protein